MALPSSGQISFNDVRVEMSQSAMTNYSTLGWVTGQMQLDGPYYAPLNILSSGSRWEDTNTTFPKRMEYESNYSMSAWYDYNHTLYMESSVTGTLYNHTKIGYQPSSTMLPINVGTTNKMVNIYVSGSLYFDTVFPQVVVDVWYGKPWNNDGSAYSYGMDGYLSNNSIRQHVTWSTVPPCESCDPLTGSINFSHTYDYTYDSNKGQYIYVVLTYYDYCYNNAC
jgi:hypothetical protein